ncbi:MAG: DUF4147 domain-containing protein, partial [Candidatus Kariarchaeaceae archaeon]
MTTISFHIPERIPDQISNPLRMHLNAIVKAISTVKPARRVQTIPEDKITHEKQIILSIGKNAAAYTRALRQKLNSPPLDILVLQANGYSDIGERLRADWTYWEVDHPLPSDINFEATESILQTLDTLASDVVIHVIVTGGASSCFTLPEHEITPDHYVEIVKNAQSFGFNIETLNYIRSLIDRVKGGKLAARYHHHKIYTWCISDVISDDPAVIGSGPTIAGTYDIPRIEDWLQRILAPQHNDLISILKSRLSEAHEVVHSAQSNFEVNLVTTRQDLIDALIKRLEKSEFQPILANINLQGDVNDVCDEMMKFLETHA